MSELDTKLKEAKKAVRPFNVICYVNLVPFILGAVFLILGICIKDNKTIDILFNVGIGSFAAAAFAEVTTLFVGRKEFDEYQRVKKEVKNSNK